MHSLAPADRGSPVLALNSLEGRGKVTEKIRNLEERSYIVVEHGYMLKEQGYSSGRFWWPLHLHGSQSAREA